MVVRQPGVNTAVAGLLLVAAVWAADRNVAPDAVTRATRGYNTYEGDLASLTDGQYPGHSTAPGAFAWPNKGNLVFQFERPRRVTAVRIYVGGDAGGYQVRAYRGARLSDEGQTVLDSAAVLATATDFRFEADSWVELPLPAGIVTDYVELVTSSGAIFYEVEIISPADASSSVSPQTWGVIKTQVRHSSTRRQ
jgi:hypothetical protein